MTNSSYLKCSWRLKAVIKWMIRDVQFSTEEVYFPAVSSVPEECYCMCAAGIIVAAHHTDLWPFVWSDLCVSLCANRITVREESPLSNGDRVPSTPGQMGGGTITAPRSLCAAWRCLIVNSVCQKKKMKNAKSLFVEGSTINRVKDPQLRFLWAVEPWKEGLGSYIYVHYFFL